MEISDILVPVDFSPCSIRALDLALSIIVPGGDLYLMNVIDSKLLARIEEHGLGSKDEATDRMRARADEKLDSLIADRQNSTQAKLNKMIVVGVPFVEILRISKDLDFGLIVMGIRGTSSLLEELLFGSTADKVLRGTHIPVVCVP
ncbi:MAG TPA: universal stress protein [Blastocatellia bacterium]|nr:universal stress protein [Blastocatellia bacterium]